MNCPWCGKEMQTGSLVFPGRQGWLYDPMWKSDSEKYGLMDRMFHTDGVPVAGLEVSGLSSIRIRAEHCPDCGKFILSTRADGEAEG